MSTDDAQAIRLRRSFRFRHALACTSLLSLSACRTSPSSEGPVGEPTVAVATVKPIPASPEPVVDPTASTSTAPPEDDLVTWDELPGFQYSKSVRIALSVAHAGELSRSPRDECPSTLDILALEERIGSELPGRRRRGSYVSYDARLEDERGATKDTECVYRLVGEHHPGKGRPMIADGRAVVAPVDDRGPLRRQAAVLVPDEPELRAWLADEWMRDAQLEHSSVAELRRIADELIALGAPRLLVDRTRAAADDEVRHAERCLELASAYAGRRLTLGSLGSSAEARHDGLERFALRTFTEGCVAETIASLEAAVAQRSCTDRTVKAVLRTIADDEARHAELAWQTLAWCLRQRPTLTAALGQVARQRATPTPQPRRIHFVGWGRLSPSEQHRVAEDAWRLLLAPLRDELRYRS